MLTYPMQDTGGQPKYRYLYGRIRDDIMAGRIAPGERLPSKRALAQHLGVGVITVANAYDLLVSEGYVEAEERRGFFALDDGGAAAGGGRRPGEPGAAAEGGPASPAPGGTAAPKPSPAPPAAGGPPAAPPGAASSPSDPPGAARAATGIPSSPPGAGGGPQAPSEGADSLADLRANRNSMRLFPASSWNQLMRRTIAAAGEDLYGTVPYNGLAALRQAIAGYLATSRGMQVDPEQIVIGAGTEYLYSRLTQLFGRTRVFGFEDPGYQKFAVICRHSGCESRFIPIDEAGLRMDRLEESDVDVMHVSPANQFPTGSRMSVARRRELLEWAYRSSKRYVVEDDYDSEFRYRGGYLPPLFVQDGRQRVVYLNTFSKTLVPSLRISYLVLPPALMERYRAGLSFYSCTVSSFEQYTLAQFISLGYFERHISRIKTYYRKHRARVLEAFHASPLSRIARVVEHNAGTHFLLVVDTALSREQVRAAGEGAGLHLSFFSDYADAVPDDANACVLVVNYAAIEPERIEPVVQALARIFPECRGGRS